MVPPATGKSEEKIVQVEPDKVTIQCDQAFNGTAIELVIKGLPPLPFSTPNAGLPDVSFEAAK